MTVLLVYHLINKLSKNVWKKKIFESFQYNECQTFPLRKKMKQDMSFL